MGECDNCKNKKDWPCPNTCGYMGTCDGWEPKPITNADRIRAMTDEELADELFDLFAAFYDVEWSKEVLLDWLKQEAQCTSA